MSRKKLFAAGAGITLGVLGVFAYARYMNARDKLLFDLKTNSRFYNTPEGRVEYAISGDGLPILISHGTLGGYDQGLAIASLFPGDRYSFIAVSRAGYLRSSLATGRTPEEQADTYARLLDALEITQAAVIGVSGGGPSAIQLSLRHPERCWGLILISAITQTPPPLPSLMNVILRTQEIALRLDFLWWLILKIGLKAFMIMNGVDPKLAAQVVQDPEKVSIIRKIFKPVATSSQRIQGVKLDAAQIKGLPLYPVENITVPTLVVHSTTDPQVPFDGANWIATTVPDATLLKVEGGGHLCFVVYKEQVVPQIVDFLERTAPDELK